MGRDEYSRRGRYESGGAPMEHILHFWTLGPVEGLRVLRSTSDGLSEDDSHARLARHGPNEVEAAPRVSVLSLVWNQIKNPLVLLLIVAVVISILVGDWTDAAMVSVILTIGVGIAVWREGEAQNVLQGLRGRLARKTTVIRDGRPRTIPASEVVPGDIVRLSAGDIVPADCLLASGNHLFVNQSLITGESFPVFKEVAGAGVAESAPLSERRNALFLGSYVQSGIGTCLVINTGSHTLFGEVAKGLGRVAPRTEFDARLAEFGILIVRVMIVMVIFVLVANALTLGISTEVFMFAIALAVGLTPELLPLIVNYNLAVSAGDLAKRDVLVRHPKSIENLGSMDVLCTDKTGTLTIGVVELEGAYGVDGQPSPDVLREAVLNATLQMGVPNPLDQILAREGEQKELDFSSVRKAGEIPYDFVRKRISVAVEERGETRLVTKGALHSVLAVCSRTHDGRPIDEMALREIDRKFQSWSARGSRVLGVASTKIGKVPRTSEFLESGMTFLGFLVFLDRPKESIREALRAFEDLGIKVKIISGDNSPVTTATARAVGLSYRGVVEGESLDRVSDDELPGLVEVTDIFSEVGPSQKERILLAIKKNGHVVGYMGDGINDVAAIRVADASVSVESAVDVVKSAADLILLEKDLEVLREAVAEGRRTFVNSVKYINITMSANFGNMISMAVASIILPFLPLLPSQVLLNNLLSDIPTFGLARDNVDADRLSGPTRWNIDSILRFMLVFGLISSVFDALAFAVLLRGFHSSPLEFRTGWFIVSLLTELAIIAVLRTRKPLWKSHPKPVLGLLIGALIIVTLAIPYLPIASALGFTPLSWSVLAVLVGITVGYVVVTELAKRRVAEG